MLSGKAKNKSRLHACAIPRARGFTLIEMMIVVVVVAILAAIAVPGFNDFITKNRVKSAAEDIYGLLLQAKSEAPIRDTNISVNTNAGATPWCVGFSTAANCDCTNTTSCVVPVAGTNVLQVVNGTSYTGVTIAETFAGTGFTFNRIRGTASTVATQDSINVTSGNWQLNVVISPEGRIRMCNPNNNVMTGYESC